MKEKLWNVYCHAGTEINKIQNNSWLMLTQRSVKGPRTRTTGTGNSNWLIVSRARQKEVWSYPRSLSHSLKKQEAISWKEHLTFCAFYFVSILCSKVECINYTNSCGSFIQDQTECQSSSVWAKWWFYSLLLVQCQQLSLYIFTAKRNGGKTGNFICLFPLGPAIIKPTGSGSIAPATPATLDVLCC